MTQSLAGKLNQHSQKNNNLGLFLPKKKLFLSAFCVALKIPCSHTYNCFDLKIVWINWLRDSSAQCERQLCLLLCRVNFSIFYILENERADKLVVFCAPHTLSKPSPPLEPPSSRGPSPSVRWKSFTLQLVFLKWWADLFNLACGSISKNLINTFFQTTEQLKT